MKRCHGMPKKKKKQLVHYHLNGQSTCQSVQVKTHRTRRKNIVENEGGRPLVMFQWTTRSLHRPNPGAMLILSPSTAPPQTLPHCALSPLLQSIMTQFTLVYIFLLSWPVTCLTVYAFNFRRRLILISLRCIQDFNLFGDIKLINLLDEIMHKLLLFCA